MQPVDSSILHEIVRVVGARSKVPERVKIRGKDYQLTYLDDHKQRLEDALRRHDLDRLNMLYGQMASKVKYQLLRQVGARRATGPAGKAAGDRGKSRVSARRRPASSRKPARVKRKSGSVKGKSAAVKKRGAVAKKAAVAKKRTASRAARR